MKTVCVVTILLLPSLCLTQQSGWSIPPDAKLLTRWAKDVDPLNPLPEYPRPQMVRQQWQSLNGVWEFTEAPERDTPPFGTQLPGIILVPFPVESALSGVMRHVDRMWYRRTFEIPAAWTDHRILLHFGAVDWEASIFVNGRQVGVHRGGYDPFSFDITDALNETGLQEIVVGVSDPTDTGDQPRGKQVLRPEGIWYTPTTGIWQTVWLEPVPSVHITNLHIVPDPDSARFLIDVDISGDAAGITISAELLEGERTVSSASGSAGIELSIPVPSPILWSPDHPHLYGLRVMALQGKQLIDAVDSYSGLRSVEIGQDENGTNRIFLNGKPVFMVGPLDQGFWPDGIYTAPTDEALRYDIEATKQLGFNMTRKHVKVEPDRWYYWADRLGLLVWQDMPSAGNKTPEGRSQFEIELGQMIRSFRNHPSIVMWVIFNEGWGQFDTGRLTDFVRNVDPTRLVNSVSGWEDKQTGHVNDIHSYPQPKSPPAEAGRAVVLGEFGGLGLAVEGHTWQTEHWGYQGMKNTGQLMTKYESFMRRVYTLKNDPGLSAAVYTQITDVEIECNGLLTYDRAVVKPDSARLSAANRGDFSLAAPEPLLHVLVPTSQEDPQQWRYTFERPGEAWMDPQFDDSQWQKGPGGFGTLGEGTPVRTEWNGSDIWMRRIFSVNIMPGDSLAFLLFHDEDVEIYLNGALAMSEGGWTAEYDLFEMGRKARVAIKHGENIIAVHCKNTEVPQYVDVGIVRVEPARKK